VIVPQSDMFLR